MWEIASWYHYIQWSFFSFHRLLFYVGYILSFIYLFVCFQSVSYLMYYIAIFGAILLCLIFHSFKPYSYPYPIILTLKVYQSVVLKVVQLFLMSSLFLILPTHNSLKYIHSKAYVSKYWPGGKLSYFYSNLLSKLKTLSSDYFVCQLEHFLCYTITLKCIKIAIVVKLCI